MKRSECTSEEGWRRCGFRERGRRARFPAEATRWTGELFLKREMMEEKDTSAMQRLEKGRSLWIISCFLWNN